MLMQEEVWDSAVTESAVESVWNIVYISVWNLNFGLKVTFFFLLYIDLIIQNFLVSVSDIVT